MSAEGFDGAAEFLAAASRYSQADAPSSSADRPIRLARVSENYTGGLVPVRFEGEELAGAKRYASLTSYTPQPDDRVALVPIGSTWLIIGAVDSAPSRFPEWRNIAPASYSGGWRPFSTNEFQASPQYIRSADGLVKLKGLVAEGDITNTAVIFTLPEGYRPTGQLHFPTVSAGDSNRANDRPAMLRVRPDGAVTVGFGVGQFWVSLDSISFVAER
jgi:hypothetical protein